MTLITYAISSRAGMLAVPCRDAPLPVFDDKALAAASKQQNRTDASVADEIASRTGLPAIELTPAELEQYTDNLGWIDVCKGWQPAEA